ncbi:MAG: HTH domain-containing protein [Euryarchaeota archaeon]|jgi:predicted transcriptional regulator|nr:HTH domain-containing protein [Euryarchaeota archaeon]
MPTDKLPDDLAPEDVNWPETLRITISTPEEAAERALAAAEAAERGEQSPAEISFASANKLRKLLTDRRFEIIRSLMDEPAPSISALADRLDRSYSVVHDDIEVLAEYGIVQFRSDRRNRAPFVPYETIDVSLTIQGTRSDGVETVG